MTGGTCHTPGVYLHLPALHPFRKSAVWPQRRTLKQRQRFQDLSSKGGKKEIVVGKGVMDFACWMVGKCDMGLLGGRPVSIADGMVEISDTEVLERGRIRRMGFFEESSGRQKFIFVAGCGMILPMSVVTC